MKVISRSRSNRTSVSYQLFIMKRRNCGETRATTSKVCLSILNPSGGEGSAELVFFDHQTRISDGRNPFDFFPIRRTENVIPKTTGDPEVHVGVLMMNEVVSSQFSILSILEMEVMMNVMKHAVEDEPGRQARHEGQDEMQMQPVSDDIPHARQKSRDDEPGHGDQRFGRFVMFLVTDVGRRPAFVIDPSMKSVFKQAPAQQARAKGDAQREDAGAKDDRFPEQEEHDRDGIADKAEPVVAAASRQTDQSAFFGTTKGLRFSVLIDRHFPILWFFREAYDKRSVPFAPRRSAPPATGGIS